MSGVSFVRFYAEKWRNGCATLSLEAEGLYIRIAAFRWDAGRRVPADRKKASALLRVNYNKYTKVLDELISERLVVETVEGLVIERAEVEYEIAAEALAKRRVSKPNAGGEDGEADPGQQGETSADPVRDEPPRQPTPQLTGLVTQVVTPPVHAEIRKQNQSAPIELDKDSDVAVVDAQAREIDWKALEAKLVEAAGSAIASQAIAPGLANIATAFRWLSGGCDLECDILPTIRAIAAKPRRQKIVAWEFFTQAIVDARAARLAPLPKAREADPDAACDAMTAKKRTSARPDWVVERDQRRAKFREAIDAAEERMKASNQGVANVHA